MDTDTKEFHERVELTHAQQVERFGWCMCDDGGHVSDGCTPETKGV